MIRRLSTVIIYVWMICIFPINVFAQNTPQSLERNSDITAPKPVSVNDKLVWCHYVAWCDWNKTSSSVTNYYDFPLAHPTGDYMKDYRQEIKAAMECGITGFFVDFVNGIAFYEHTLWLLQAARGTPFMVSICLDGFVDPAPEFAGKVAAFLKDAEKYPNLARVDGKPLIITYAGDRVNAEYWKQFRRELANKYGEIFLVVDPGSPDAYQNCFDMEYNFNALDNTQVSAALNYPKLKKAAKTTLSGKWMAGIAPGYAGSWPVIGRNDYYSGFCGVDQYWNNWELALKEQAGWIHLTTWNDLDETPLQPMAFQFHSYLELTRYWINRWKGIDKPSVTPRLYLAYQREQILGTVQRIELVSLPATARQITTSLELRGIDGKVLAKLPAKTFTGSKAIRQEWAVPTAAFSKTPVIEPVIHVKTDKTNYSRRLPVFVLRTGWIVNKTCVRVPVHEMSDGNAKLSVSRDANEDILAVVKIKSVQKIRNVTLWRNDRPIGTFYNNVKSGTRYHLGFDYLQDTIMNIHVADGKILNAYYTGDSSEKPDLKWSAESMAANFWRYRYLAAELLDNGGAALDLVVNDSNKQTVTMAQLKQAPVDLKNAAGQVTCRLMLTEVDSTAISAPSLDLQQGTVTGRWYTKNSFSEDMFYVRCETVDGRCFFSNVVTPFITDKKAVNTVVLQTAVTLDGGGVGGGGYSAYFNRPPFTIPEPKQAGVHPAMVQEMCWNFDGDDAWADSRGWNGLHPGSGIGAMYYSEDVNRKPNVVTREDTSSRCAVFDGIDDIVEIPIRQMPIGAFAISMDIFPDGDIGKEQAIISHIGWQSCPVLRILSDGRLQGGQEHAKEENSAQNGIFATSADTLPVKAWSHIKMTFDEKTVRLFVNGRLVGTATGKPARSYGNLRIYLGGDQNGHNFKGKLDNILISSIPKP